MGLVEDKVHIEAGEFEVLKIEVTERPDVAMMTADWEKNPRKISEEKDVHLTLMPPLGSGIPFILQDLPHPTGHDQIVADYRLATQDDDAFIGTWRAVFFNDGTKDLKNVAIAFFVGKIGE